MTSGFGVDPTKTGGIITSGTTAKDIRLAFGGLYTPGLISGGKVTTSTSAMRYTVSAGVAVVESAPGSGENIIIPIPATTLNPPVVPAGASRTDIVYAQQRTPSADGDSEVVVNYGTTLPARAVRLASYVQPAGATVSSSGTANANVDYSIPYGATLGQLHYYQHKYQGAMNPSVTERVGAGTIYLPTDRRVNFKVSAVLHADNASGFDNSKYCEYGFLPNIDGGDMAYFTTPGLHQGWATYQWDITIDVAAGLHTVNLGMKRVVGPGTVYTRYGLDGAGYGRRGIEFFVTDAGPIK